jgi:putative ABC transport system permease protein
MHLSDGIKSALSSITSHKLRSVLTTTGIVIGVMAVVTMFSSVYALKALINKNMEGMGWNNSFLIYPGVGYQRGADNSKSVQRKAKQSVSPLSIDDYLALKDNLDYKSIYAMVENTSLFRMSNKDHYVNVRATDNGFFDVKNYPVSKGSLFNRMESEAGQPVVVLGHLFAEEYYPGQNPVGKNLVLGNHRFKVIGILGADVLNTSAGVNFNTWERREDLRAVYIPLRYGVYYMGSNKVINTIYVQANNPEHYARLKAHARQLLLSRHNMYPNFNVADVGSYMLNITDEIDKQMKKWNITLSVIASISLLVGGIGLFSTLLISIQERMTEIGIRKSIGATDQDIFFYFIMEALSLAIFGATIGILIAWGLVTAMGKALHFPLYLPLAGVALGLAFSSVIGFLSGLYPAIKAAQIDPIKAIYYHD